VSIHLSSAMGTLRRVVLSCDVPGCPNQSEPPAAEAWRSDSDARTLARDQAVGWTYDPIGQADYCPAHAGLTGRAADIALPQPTAAARDQAGNPLDRKEYAQHLRARLGAAGSTGDPLMLSPAQATVVARLLDELAGIYRGESLGALAHEMAAVLDNHVAPD
jgi:hypothetical protein